MKTTILVITSKEDVHADSVIRYLQGNWANDYIVIRLNTEDFALNSKVSFDGNYVFVELEDSKKVIKSNEVCSVWFRRPKPVESTHPDPNVALFIKNEWNAFLRGLYFCTHDESIWVNPLPNLHRARIKLQQLQLARKLNLNVPETIVSNDYEKIKELFKKHKTICAKTLDKPSFKESENKYLPIYTRTISHSYLFSMKESLSLSPTIFQQFIKKVCDIRVIVIGNSITAFAIYSKPNSQATIDFRYGFTEGLRHEVIVLPKALEVKLLKFVETQGLVFSAIDMVLDEKKQFWFLENNPNGQWLWLEFETNFPLTRIMSEKLVSNPVKP